METLVSAFFIFPIYSLYFYPLLKPIQSGFNLHPFILKAPFSVTNYFHIIKLLISLDISVESEVVVFSLSLSIFYKTYLHIDSETLCYLCLLSTSVTPTFNSLLVDLLLFPTFNSLFLGFLSHPIPKVGVTQDLMSGPLFSL